MLPATCRHERLPLEDDAAQPLVPRRSDAVCTDSQTRASASITLASFPHVVWPFPRGWFAPPGLSTPLLASRLQTAALGVHMSQRCHDQRHTTARKERDRETAQHHATPQPTGLPLSALALATAGRLSIVTAPSTAHTSWCHTVRNRQFVQI